MFGALLAVATLAGSIAAPLPPSPQGGAAVLAGALPVGLIVRLFGAQRGHLHAPAHHAPFAARRHAGLLRAPVGTAQATRHRAPRGPRPERCAARRAMAAAAGPGAAADPLTSQAAPHVRSVPARRAAFRDAGGTATPGADMTDTTIAPAAVGECRRGRHALRRRRRSRVRAAGHAHDGARTDRVALRRRSRISRHRGGRHHGASRQPRTSEGPDGCGRPVQPPLRLRRRHDDHDRQIVSFYNQQHRPYHRPSLLQRLREQFALNNL